MGPRGDVLIVSFLAPSSADVASPPRLFRPRRLLSHLRSPGRTSGGKSPCGTKVPEGGACAAPPVRRSGETPTSAPRASRRPEVRTSAPSRHPVTSLGDGDFLKVPRAHSSPGGRRTWARLQRRAITGFFQRRRCHSRHCATQRGYQCVQEEVSDYKGQARCVCDDNKKGSSTSPEKATSERKGPGREGDDVGLNITVMTTNVMEIKLPIKELLNYIEKNQLIAAHKGHI